MVMCVHMYLLNVNEKPSRCFIHRFPQARTAARSRRSRSQARRQRQLASTLPTAFLYSPEVCPPCSPIVTAAMVTSTNAKINTKQTRRRSEASSSPSPRSPPHPPAAAPRASLRAAAGRDAGRSRLTHDEGDGSLFAAELQPAGRPLPAPGAAATAAAAGGPAGGRRAGLVVLP